MLGLRDIGIIVPQILLFVSYHLIFIYYKKNVKEQQNLLNHSGWKINATEIHYFCWWFNQKLYQRPQLSSKMCKSTILFSYFDILEAVPVENQAQSDISICCFELLLVHFMLQLVPNYCIRITLAFLDFLDFSSNRRIFRKNV